MNKFKTKSDLFRIACIVVVSSSLFGCAYSRMPAQSPTGEPIIDMISSLKKGDLRLPCDCYGAWLGVVREVRSLYDKELWESLVIKITSVGHRSNDAYYYLGAAAEGIGEFDAARVYYKLALAETTRKCDSPFDDCNGLLFPDAANAAIRGLDYKKPATDVELCHTALDGNESVSKKQASALLKKKGIYDCDPIILSAVEDMSNYERAKIIEKKSDSELCEAYNSGKFKAKSMKQIQEALKSRGHDSCGSTSLNVPVDDYNYKKTSLSVSSINLDLLPKTVSLEHTERMNRLEKLSNQLNTQRPTIEQLQVKTPSANFPIPVIRFHFDERTFFDSGSSTIRSDSNKIIDMLAEQMKQDMPDTSLVILGHTDSVGSDENNNNLSINRSASVMQQLAQRGVNLKQMSTVGIGETQPVATNATEDGRSQNRRVEFVLSRFEEANYVAIEQFPRNTEWLNNHPEKQVELEPIIQEKLPVKTKQVVHVQPKATPVVHHNTEAKKLIVFKPTKEMLTPSNPEKITPPEPITMLKESTRTVTIIPAEIVHIIPSTQN